MKKKALRDKIMEEVVRLRTIPKNKVRIPIRFGERVIINKSGEK